MENQIIIDSLIQTIETQKKMIENLKRTIDKIHSQNNICTCQSQDEHDSVCLNLQT
jgi:hypothetical protein